MASGAELMKGCVYAAAMLSEKEAGEDEEAVTVRKANRLFRLLRAAAWGFAVVSGLAVGRWFGAGRGGGLGGGPGDATRQSGRLR